MSVLNDLKGVQALDLVLPLEECTSAARPRKANPVKVQLIVLTSRMGVHHYGDLSRTALHMAFSFDLPRAFCSWGATDHFYRHLYWADPNVANAFYPPDAE